MSILETMKVISEDRRLRERVRSALPRSGGTTGWELDYLESVIAPVVGDLVKEVRGEDEKLTAHLDHLRRRMELLDIRTRGQPEPRKILRRLERLELAVAQLRSSVKNNMA